MTSVKTFYAYGKEKLLTGESSVIFNNSAETLTMQVDELAGSVELYGTADFDSNIFYKLTGNNSSFELVNKITTDGIYHFSIEGIAKIKFVEGIVPKYGAQLPDPTNGAYKVGCSFLNTTTGGLYVLAASGSASNRSWQLQTTIEKPKWRNTLPHINDTQEIDATKVLFTKVTITTTDSTNFPGMSGKSVMVQGLSSDGFAAGTIVCDEMTGGIQYSPCFIGSITSSRASGVLIKGSNAVAVISVDNPEVSFTYEYLW